MSIFTPSLQPAFELICPLWLFGAIFLCASSNAIRNTKKPARVNSGWYFAKFGLSAGNYVLKIGPISSISFTATFLFPFTFTALILAIALSCKSPG